MDPWASDATVRARLPVGAALVAIACLVPAPSEAGAATVEVQPSSGEIFTQGLVVQAAAGERNHVVATFEATGTYLIEERAATLQARSGCSQVDSRRARCSGPFDFVEVRAEDGHDRVDATRASRAVRAYGGGGNDALLAPPGGASLHGDAGSDVLLGGAGDDSLDGGGVGTDTLAGQGGRDTLQDGDDVGSTGPNADTLDGGPGQDRLHYHRIHPVRVDLLFPTGHGQAGENDSVRLVEDVSGGWASDRLRGTDGPNELDGGGGGRDLLAGRGGPDKLERGYVNRGGQDDDVVEIPDGRVNCGSGTDLVTQMPGGVFGKRVVVGRDCEGIKLGIVPDFSVRPRLPLRSLRAPVADFSALCDRRRRPCRAVVTLRGSSKPSRFRRGRRRIVGRRALRIGPGRRVRRTVRLSRRGRRLLRRRRSVYIRVEVLLVDASFSDEQRDRFIMRLPAR